MAPPRPHRERQRAGPSVISGANHATLRNMRHSRRERFKSEPLAFFITFRCYGTWLPGDERGWTDHPGSGRDLSLRSGHPGLLAMTQDAMAHSPLVLENRHREVVGAAIRDVCTYRGWTLHALNVRTNHVHVVVSAGSAPEQVMTSLKAWSTRRLREAGLVAKEIKPWSRHGSTRYLWWDDQIEAACSYVLDGQGGHLR
jgi:REP element-mobilizing transposase RayT